MLNEVFLELGGVFAFFASVDYGLGHPSYSVTWFRNY